MTELINILQAENYSCVIKNNGEIRKFTKRGVADLFDLYNSDAAFLDGASVADKIIGKGAASLMVMGGVKQVYTHTISETALALFEKHQVSISYDKLVPVIINRDGTDWCPVEKLCYQDDSLPSILNKITGFIQDMRASSLGLILMWLLVNWNVKAQTDIDSASIKDKVHALEQVIVTGTRSETDVRKLPLTVSVVSNENIESRMQQSVLPLLTEQVPGLFITGKGVMGYGVANGSAGSMNIRGIGGSPTTGVLVLIDGEPQYMGLMGHPLADTYQNILADRVEVIRGPASVLYGSNAMGGVINIVTPKNIADGISTKAQFSYGTFNTIESNITNQIKKGKFSSKVAYSFNKTDGHRANSEFDQNSAYAKLAYQLNENWNSSFDLNISQYNASNSGTVQMPFIDNDAEIFRGLSSVTLSNNYSFSSGAFKVFYNWGEHNINNGYVQGEAPVITTFHSTDNMMGATWYQSIRVFNTGNLTLGADFFKFGGEAKTQTPKMEIPWADTTLTEVAAYVDYRHSINEVVTFDVGARYDHHTITGAQWIPQAGVSIHLPQAMQLKTMVSKGFRNPTIRELYMFGTQNPDLKAESILNYELSLHQHLIKKKLSYTVNLFYIEGENMITTAYPNGKPQYVNTGEVENYGVEASLSYRINKYLSTNTNYSFLHMENPIIASPKHKLYVGLSYSRDKFMIATGLQYIDGLYTSVNQDITEQFVLWNARVSYSILDNLSIFARGENLLNQQYEINQGFPMPGATVNTGISYKF